MTNNDVLRRIRYIFNYDDSKIISLFALAEHKVTRAEISDWLKKDDDPDFKHCDDKTMAIFLNGFINDKRGKRDGPQMEPEKKLTNNIIFRKLKIALDMKDADILEVMQSVGFNISRHELSAFFRRMGHKHYRECKDQILRNFLKGVQSKYRPNAGDATAKTPINPSPSDSGFKWKK